MIRFYGPLMVDAVEWFPDDDFAEYVNEKYCNRRVGYDAFNVEYTVTEVGIQTERGFLRLNPGDYIVTDSTGERHVFSRRAFIVAFEQQCKRSEVVNGSVP